jgi:hypothetical protein
MAAADAAPGGGLLCAGWRRRERENKGDADRGEDCVAYCHLPSLFDDGAKLSDPLYTPIVRLGALALKLGNPHLH